MSAETIKLGTGLKAFAGTSLQRQDLARMQFVHHDVAAPLMSVWMMSLPAGQPVFPWWSYDGAVDEDVNRLATLTGITSGQGLFDFLFLLQLRKTFRDGLYVIVPGNVRTDGWHLLPERAQSAFQRGQACVYRLEASNGRKMMVNWVPFFQPQCLVKDPTADIMGRFFNAAKSEEPTTSLSFFTLNDVRRMPDVVNALIQKDDRRSEKLSRLVNAFGVFSSPRDERNGACALAYASDPAALEPLKACERGFSGAVDQVRTLLLAEPTPATALKILSRLVAL